MKPKQFQTEDFHRFQQFLSLEIEDLRKYIQSNRGLLQGYSYGAELEAWITEQNFKPAPKNEWLLNSLGSKQFVPELSKYNIEYNSKVYDQSKLSLHELEKELVDAETKLSHSAAAMDSRCLLIGSLPNLCLEDMNMGAMTSKERYFTLNEQIQIKNNNEIMKYKIEGKEDVLEFECANIMPVAATTSFQMHYQMPFSDFIAAYNSSLFASSILTAITANTPFLFGKSLWDESRIPLFEQSMGRMMYNTPRVGMGFGYLKEDICEFFCNSHEEYEVFFPEFSEYRDGDFLLNRLHNGTVWHWNRVIVEKNAEQKYQSRIEFRPCSSGPTPVDMTAHFAFYIGLVKAITSWEIQKFISFSKLKKSFYNTALDSLDAKVYNFFGVKQNVRDWMLSELLDLAKSGLEQIGINKEEAVYYIDGILRPRMEASLNGAAWQKSFVGKYGKDFENMLDVYWYQQRENRALKDWNYGI